MGRRATAGQYLCPIIVGRDAELDAIDGLLDSARAHEGTVLFISGEPGIGKTRLAREAVTRARNAGMAVLQGRCAPSLTPTPFRPFVEAFQRSRLDEDDVPRAFREDRSVEPNRLRVFDEISRSLATAGLGGGLLLVLEDLHWADDETLDAIDYLSDDLSDRAVAIIGTLRDDPGAALDLAQRLTARRAAHRVDLDRLDPPAVTTMTAAALDRDDPPAPLLDALAARAEGVPFVVEEMIAAFMMSGGGDSVPPTMPASYRDIVRERLATLDEQTRAVLSVAAVVGRRFDWTVLAAATGLDRERLLERLRDGVRAHILTADPTGGFEMPFGFRHALVRDAILAEMLPPELQDLSRKAADAVESSFPGLPGEWCERAAELRERAGDHGKAAAHLQEAAQRALVRGALASAEAMLERARSLTPNDRWHRVGVDRQLVEVLSLAGKVERLQEIGAASLAFMSEKQSEFPFVQLGLGYLHLRLAKGLATAGDDADADQHIARAHASAKETADERLEARVMAFEAYRALERGDMKSARELAASARAIAEALGLADVLFESRSVEGNAAFHAGDAERALEELRRARDDSSGAVVQRMRALIELGSVEASTTGEIGSLEAARTIAVEVGAVSTHVRAELAIGDTLVRGFELDQAGTVLAGCIETARRFRLALLSQALDVEAQRLALIGSEELAVAAIHEAGSAPVARAVLALLREDRRAAHASLTDASSDIAVSLRSLIAALKGDIEQPSSAADALGRGLAAASRAALHGGDGGAEALASLQPFPWWQAITRRLLAEIALRDGWADPAALLREALAFFDAAGHERPAQACRAMLRDTGAPVPRKGRGEAVVPADLRARGITSREMDVLLLVADGLQNREIAARLFVSARTVETHVGSLQRKLGVSSRADLIAAAQEGLAP